MQFFNVSDKTKSEKEVEQQMTLNEEIFAKIRKAKENTYIHRQQSPVI